MLIKDPVPGISATPHEDNLRHFIVRVEGPPETPYAGAWRSSESMPRTWRSSASLHSTSRVPTLTVPRWLF